MDFKFSVVIAVYKNDNPEYFCQAFYSIINQTIKPTEIILVIDGPIPLSIRDLVNNWKEQFGYLKVVESKVNLGHGKARRLGIENCSENIIALMDSDDISIPERFELQLNFLKENPDIKVLGGNIDEFENEENNIVATRKVFSTDIEITQDLKRRCPINQMTVMFYKDIIQNAGGYLDWYCNEDYYLWIRLKLNSVKFANLDKTLVKVRVDNNMYSRRGGLSYFKSEYKIQRLLLEKKIIDKSLFTKNVIVRLFVQVLSPNWLRKLIFINIVRR